MAEQDETAMTVAEVARYLNVHPNTVYRRANDGELPGFRIKRTWRFFQSQIDAALTDTSDPWAAPRSRRRVA